MSTDDERRSGIERREEDHETRIRHLEKIVTNLDKTVALTEVRVQGLATTIESRFKAFDRGQDLILEKLEGREDRVERRLNALETVRAQAEGAIWLARVLGVTGIGRRSRRDREDGEGVNA